MEIEFDPRKRVETLTKRGLDFLDAPIVFAEELLTVEDTRHPYGEARNVTRGYLDERLIVVGWTLRLRNGVPVRRIFSMRKANEREIALVQE